MKLKNKLSGPRRTIWPAVFLLVFTINAAMMAACGPLMPLKKPPERGKPTLVVFAAASLAEAFTQIGEQFRQQHPEVKILFNFAGSQQLAQQLAQGAPADLFASANEAQMLAAVQEGRVAPGSYQGFAGNRLIVILPPGNPAGIRDLSDLAKTGLRLVLADPSVPAGKYAQDFIALAAQDPAYGAAYQKGVTGNIVSYEENVRAVLSKVLLGEADAGIVYRTDIHGLDPDEIETLQIPDQFNPLVSYAIASIADSTQPELAQSFMAAVQSPAGQETLRRFGFLPVP
jgi:molybdate transport system substrate-binding protein